jgi:hypothetical protein
MDNQLSRLTFVSLGPGEDEGPAYYGLSGVPGLRRRAGGLDQPKVSNANIVPYAINQGNLTLGFIQALDL